LSTFAKPQSVRLSKVRYI